MESIFGNYKEILFRLALFLILASVIPRSISADEIARLSTQTRRLKIDFEGPVFEDPGYTVKDHALIMKDGIYHLYYIRGTGQHFGYATSPDLKHWTIHQPILEAGPDRWDEKWIWAPHVVPSCYDPGYYYMYYTGVNANVAQRTCLAYTTKDLSKWIKSPIEMFEPFHGDTSWILWNEDHWSNYRDPFFFSDNGTNYLIHSVITRDGLGAVAAASSGGCIEWEDAGPLYVHDNWHMLESCVLIKHMAKYHLFFTEEEVGGISYMASDSLCSGWDIVTRMIIDGGHACELLQSDTDEYVFSRHSGYSLPGGSMLYTIRFDTLCWNGDFPEVRKTEVLDSMWTTLWGTAFDRQPVYGNSYLYRGIDTIQIGYEGNWWIGTYERFDGPIFANPGSVQGDTARGAIRSRDFTIRGLSMRLLVGGGNYPDSCYIALCDSETDAIIYSETGKNRELMDERLWSLERLRGKSVYLKIVDSATGIFGHINVDGIEERARPIIIISDSTKGGPPPKDTYPAKGARFSKPRSGNPNRTISVRNYPNPFNPSTNLVITGTPGADFSIEIFSVSGRRIRTIPVRCGSSGRGYAVWKGRDQYGNRVSSGVYSAVVSCPKGEKASAKLILIR